MVVAVSEDAAPLEPLPDRVHWCCLGISTDDPADPNLGGIRPAALSGMQLWELLSHPDVKALYTHRQHNWCSAIFCYYGGVLTLRVGVIAKGFIPRSEEPFPQQFSCSLADGTHVKFRVDVCRGTPAYFL